MAGPPPRGACASSSPAPGGAAHLPGMLAALTELPVIGVPVPLKHLDGVDSLHSIVQMPAGVPVATVSIAGARNAGLLAARILGAGEGERAETLRGAMRDFQKDLRDVASAKGAALAERVSHRALSAPERPNTSPVRVATGARRVVS